MRAFRAGDEPALAEVCLRTADAGADATGLLDDDALWAELFVLPYVARHPDFALVVESDDARVIGYAVATPDTLTFEGWFRDEWWPRFAERWPAPGDDDSRQADLLRYAYGRAPGAEPHGAEHPAHLHIDLLPEAQGQGWGRRLIDALAGRLREAGVPSLHLVASADNAGAIAFYERLEFIPLASAPGSRAFALSL
jgi:ribosomal protein S18 acetylase RimI-like enzyme